MTSPCDVTSVRYEHSLLILSLITRWLAILALSSYRGIVWTHNHYAGLRSDTHIRCMWSLQGPLIININFTQCYARYYQYFTCRSLDVVPSARFTQNGRPHVNRRRAPGVIRLNGYDMNCGPLILSEKNRGNVDSTCHQPVIYGVVTVNNCYL